MTTVPLLVNMAGRLPALWKSRRWCTAALIKKLWEITWAQQTTVTACCMPLLDLTGQSKNFRWLISQDERSKHSDRLISIPAWIDTYSCLSVKNYQAAWLVHIVNCQARSKQAQGKVPELTSKKARFGMAQCWLGNTM